MLRIAEEKYVLKLGKTKNLVEAMKMFWDDHCRE